MRVCQYTHHTSISDLSSNSTKYPHTTIPLPLTIHFPPSLISLQMPNDYLSFRDVETETHHPIRLYTRYIDKARRKGETGA